MEKIKDLDKFDSKRPVLIIASGPSLTDYDFTDFEKYQTIAVNIAGTLFSPDIHFFRDDKLWREYHEHKYDHRTQVVCPADEAYGEMKRRNGCRLFACEILNEVEDLQNEIKPNELWVKSNVITGAIHLAWKLGAEFIDIYGLDGYFLPDRREHCAGKIVSKRRWLKENLTEVKDGPKRYKPKKFDKWNADCILFNNWLKRQKPKVDILNHNPLSLFTPWRKTEKI